MKDFGYDGIYFTMELRLVCVTVFIVVGYQLVIKAEASSTNCDRQANHLLIEFEFTSVNAWQKIIRDKLKSSVAIFVNSFCRKNTSLCGMKNSRLQKEDMFDEDGDSNQFITSETSNSKVVEIASITTSNIIIVGSYPAKEKRNSLLEVVIKLPIRGIADQQCKYLRKNILKEIIKGNRKKLQGELLDSARQIDYTPAFSFRVSRVGGERLYPEDLHKANAIAIPIIFGFLLLLALIVAFLQVYRPIKKCYQFCIARRRRARRNRDLRLSDLQRHFTRRQRDLPLIPKQIVERGPLVDSPTKTLPRYPEMPKHKRENPKSRKVVVRENGQVEIVYSTYSDCTVIEMTRRHQPNSAR